MVNKSATTTAARKQDRRYFPFLFGSTIALCVIGITMVLSASSVQSVADSGTTFSIVFKQILFLVLGGALAYGFFRMPTNILPKLAKFVWMGACGLQLLIFVPRLGVPINGNLNWLSFGSIRFQPSEFGKFALILWVATALTRPGLAPGQALIRAAIGSLPIIGMVLIGKDLGTALILFGILFVMLFIAGVSSRLLGLVGLGGIALSTLLIMTQSHRLQRFTALLDPFSKANYQDAGWQPAHGIMALASGGLFGVGLGGGSQKWGNLGPEAHTDFIFAVIGEELGLFGTLLLIGLFGLVLWCGVGLAIRTKDAFSRLFVIGMTGWITLQALTNMGSAIGVFPVVGVPLPLVSYGGSSLIATLIGIGVLLRIARDRADK